MSDLDVLLTETRTFAPPADFRQSAVDALRMFGSEADTLRALAQFVTARKQ